MAKYSILLMAVIFILFTEALAVPTKRQTAITIPIRSTHRFSPRGIHPRLYIQRHINGATRRLARMTGRAIPSDDELRAALYNLMDIPAADAPAVSSHESHRKRYTSRNINPQRLQDISHRFANNDAEANTNSGVSSIDIEAAKAGPSNVTTANLTTASNSIGLDIEAADMGYLGDIQIGTPPKNYTLLFDTVSADTWVGSATYCIGKDSSGSLPNCGQHHFLNNQTSSTFFDTQQHWSIRYGPDYVTGTVVTDTMSVAGMTLTKHAFGTVNVESLSFANSTTRFDGLFGLGQFNLSMQGVHTPVEALQIQGLISNSIVSIKISRLADSKNDGEVTFGTLDHTKFDNTTLVTIPNRSMEGFWEAPMDTVTVDGQDLKLEGRSAIVDIGTAFILAPQNDAVAVHNLIPGSVQTDVGHFTLPCTSSASVAFSFSGRNFPIDTRDLVTVPVNNDDPTGTCFSAISGQPTPGGRQWLMGDAFLKNVYISLDTDNNSVSFANLV